MAEKLTPIDLAQDRTDAVPTDPDTHRPSANLPARYINEMVEHILALEQSHNDLIDEVNALRQDQQESGNLYPTMLHRFILWGKGGGSVRPSFIPDDTGKPQRLLFAGSPAWNADGAQIRAASASGPQYAYADVPGIDMTKSFSAWALVRDSAASPDGSAFVSVASSTSGRGYVATEKRGGGIGGVLRALDDSPWNDTFSAPGTGPIPYSGDDWKLVEVAKGSDYLNVIQHVRRELQQDPHFSRREYAAGVTAKMKPTDTRVACGIIPRLLEAGEFKGLANCTLGALFVFSGVPTVAARGELYAAIRQQMQQDNVAEVLLAPRS